MKIFLAFKLSDLIFIMLINVKMPTIVSILTFLNMINFILSRVEHSLEVLKYGNASPQMYVY